jgi:N-acetylglucosaminyl-diphospho-decaprenol L-rhamnosyltransferase
MPATVISVSVVSHGQAHLVSRLLRDIRSLGRDDLQIILTVNLPETLPAEARAQEGVEVIRNATARGFGANHNAAFRAARGEFFCVLNPDIRLAQDPFPALLTALREPQVALAAPCIVDGGGRLEDSARRFPTVASLLKKLFRLAPRLDYPADQPPPSPDWVAGMFMLFRREAFEKAGGFDARFFLYYEDVDLCRRLRRLGFDVRLVPQATVTHEAQRASRRDLKHMLWHAKSMLRYLTTNYG